VIGQRFTDVFRLRCSQAHPGHDLIDELDVGDRSKPPSRRILPVPDIVAPLAVPPELSMALRAVPPDDTTPASLKTVSPVATRTSALETNPPEDVVSVLHIAAARDKWSRRRRCSPPCRPSVQYMRLSPHRQLTFVRAVPPDDTNSPPFGIDQRAARGAA
jgi:hypothetical protein